ncbi:phage major capsid protein, partial [Hafnia alvei]|uniref:phage major capsid protein n=1 Tax=Hafnia alvei TaxID=569 RepID=UPI001866C243
MKKLLELRQKKTELTAQMRSILTKSEEENRSLTDEESKQFDAIKTQAESLSTEIQRFEDLADAERKQAEKTPEDKSNRSKATNDELRTYIMTGDTRSLSTGVPADGGYTVIPDLDKQIMRQLSD